MTLPLIGMITVPKFGCTAIVTVVPLFTWDGNRISTGVSLVVSTVTTFVPLLGVGTGAAAELGAAVAFCSERAVGTGLAKGTAVGKVAAAGARVLKVGSMGAAVADTILGGGVEVLATGAEMVGVDGATGSNACGADTGPLLPDPPHKGCPRPVHAEQKLVKSPLQLTLPVGHPLPSQQVHSSKVASEHA
jgi:hypothetical protein